MHAFSRQRNQRWRIKRACVCVLKTYKLTAKLWLQWTHGACLVEILSPSFGFTSHACYYSKHCSLQPFISLLLSQLQYSYQVKVKLKRKESLPSNIAIWTRSFSLLDVSVCDWFWRFICSRTSMGWRPRSGLSWRCRLDWFLSVWHTRPVHHELAVMLHLNH
jgi:hypothetical protein